MPTYCITHTSGPNLDRGLYGTLIIEDPNEGAAYDDELVVVLDDWIDGTGTNPDQVLDNLRKTGMKPMAPGGPGVTPTSPLGEDGGDVTYPHFLINGCSGRRSRDYANGLARYQRRLGYGVSRGGARCHDVRHPNRRLRGAATATSVILGMGERVDAIINLDTSVPVVAIAEGNRARAVNLR